MGGLDGADVPLFLPAPVSFSRGDDHVETALRSLSNESLVVRCAEFPVLPNPRTPPPRSRDKGEGAEGKGARPGPWLVWYSLHQGPMVETAARGRDARCSDGHPQRWDAPNFSASTGRLGR